MLEPKEIIRCKCLTFRRTLQVFIWWDSEYYSNIWLEDMIEYVEWSAWCAFLSVSDNCNIIWLPDYNLDDLVHELVHTAEHMCEQCGMRVWWEPMAYIVQELLIKILSESKWKFKVNKNNIKFFK